MKLTVTHVTEYTYDTPQKAVLQSLRLVPSEFSGQHVTDWAIAVDGGVMGSRFRDGAGDLTETWRVRGPVSSVKVSVSGSVDTTDMAGVLRGHREKVPPMAYLRSTRMTRGDAPMRWQKRFPARWRSPPGRPTAPRRRQRRSRQVRAYARISPI